MQKVFTGNTKCRTNSLHIRMPIVLRTHHLYSHTKKKTFRSIQNEVTSPKI